jgi:transposase
MGKAIPLRDLTPDELVELERLDRSRKTERRLAERVEIILSKRAGERTSTIARRLGCDADTVARWVKRFNALGMEGLADRPGRGRRRQYNQQERGRMIALARTHPQGVGLPFGYWTVRRLATYLNQVEHIRISRAQLARVLEAEGLRWYQETTYFTERPDPQFAQKRGR